MAGRYLPLTVLMAAALFYLSGAGEWLSLDSLARNYQALLGWIAYYNHSSVFLYILFFVMIAAAALPAATVYAFFGGLLFGLWAATAYAVLGATLGAFILFFAARMAFAETFRVRFRKTAQKIADGFDQNGISYIFSLRLMPIFPFFVVNAGLALTNIRVWTFLWTTAAGIAPGIFIYAYLGFSMRPLIAKGQWPNLQDLLSSEIILALSLLSMLSLLPIAWKKYKLRKTVL